MIDTKGFIAMAVNALVKSPGFPINYFPPSKEGRCGVKLWNTEDLSTLRRAERELMYHSMKNVCLKSHPNINIGIRPCHVIPA